MPKSRTEALMSMVTEHVNSYSTADARCSSGDV